MSTGACPWTSSASFVWREEWRTRTRTWRRAWRGRVGAQHQETPKRQLHEYQESCSEYHVRIEALCVCVLLLVVGILDFSYRKAKKRRKKKFALGTLPKFQNL